MRLKYMSFYRKVHFTHQLGNSSDLAMYSLTKALSEIRVTTIYQSDQISSMGIVLSAFGLKKINDYIQYITKYIFLHIAENIFMVAY